MGAACCIRSEPSLRRLIRCLRNLGKLLSQASLREAALLISASCRKHPWTPCPAFHIFVRVPKGAAHSVTDRTRAYAALLLVAKLVAPLHCVSLKSRRNRTMLKAKGAVAPCFRFVLPAARRSPTVNSFHSFFFVRSLLIKLSYL